MGAAGSNRGIVTKEALYSCQMCQVQRQPRAAAVCCMQRSLVGRSGQYRSARTHDGVDLVDE